MVQGFQRFSMVSILAFSLSGMAAQPKPTPVKPAPAQGKSATIKVMSYNIQNFFDTVHNPDKADDEFTPTGKQKWTEQILADKIKNLGEVISSQNPDILGVTEVENQQVLDRLVKEGLPNMGYKTVLAGPSDDGRGIRCGIISRFPIVTWSSHKVWKDSWQAEGRTDVTRDILDVTLDTMNGDPQGYVTVYVNHWPSRRLGAVRDQERLEIAQQMNQFATDLLRSNPGRTIISVGDFNDEVTSAAMTTGNIFAKSISELNSAAPGTFYSINWELEKLPAAQKGTFYFARDHVWNALDHIMFALGDDALKARTKAYRYVVGSVQIVRPAKFITSNGGIPVGCELDDRRMRGDSTRCLGGVSDHLAKVATFEFR